jgi:hypothetical protein
MLAYLLVSVPFFGPVDPSATAIWASGAIAFIAAMMTIYFAHEASEKSTDLEALIENRNVLQQTKEEQAAEIHGLQAKLDEAKEHEEKTLAVQKEAFEKASLESRKQTQILTDRLLESTITISFLKQQNGEIIKRFSVPKSISELVQGE